MAACFADRAEAGRQLAEKLTAYRDRNDVLVLALPRGGAPVAYEVVTPPQISVRARHRSDQSASETA